MAISIVSVASIIYKISGDRLNEQVIAINQAESNELAVEMGTWLASFMTMIDASGSADSILESDRLGVQTYLAKLMKLDDSIPDIYYGMENGQIINGSGYIPPKDYDPRKRPWYKEAMSAAGTSIGEPYQDMLTKKMVVAVTKKITGSDGKMKGVLAADILLTKITDRINETKIGESGYAFIMTGKGVIIAHPNQEMIGKNGFEDFNEAGDSIKTLTQTVTSKTEGHHVYELEGEDRIAAFSNIPNTDWKVVVTIPTKELMKDARRMALLILSVTSLFVLLSSVAIVLLARRITAPIIQLSDAALKLEAGDLTIRTRLERKDEIGTLSRNFDRMADAMERLVHDISKSTVHIEQTSNAVVQSTQQAEVISSQIANAVHELAKGAEHQASSISEGVTRVVAVHDAVDQVSGHIDAVYSQTESIDGMTILGQKTIKIQNEKMAENTAANGRVNEAIGLLHDKTNEISQIVNVIDGIAAQTNLLALNASIEAARAGEQGKGFSVVADEIRKLAELSSQSTGRIAESISEIVSRTQIAVGEAEVASKALEAQTEAATKVIGIFDEVRSAVVDMKSDFAKVKGCNQDIKEKIIQVRSDMATISEITQNNAASSEEVAASTEQQVTSLQEIKALSENVKCLGVELRDAVKGLQK